jgi:hypothetical protein
MAQWVFTVDVGILARNRVRDFLMRTAWETELQIDSQQVTRRLVTTIHATVEGNNLGQLRAYRAKVMPQCREDGFTIVEIVPIPARRRTSLHFFEAAS